jgi:hypothetical protein
MISQLIRTFICRRRKLILLNVMQRFISRHFSNSSYFQISKSSWLAEILLTIVISMNYELPYEACYMLGDYGGREGRATYKLPGDAPKLDE